MTVTPTLPGVDGITLNGAGGVAWMTTGPGNAKSEFGTTPIVIYGETTLVSGITEII